MSARDVAAVALEDRTPFKREKWMKKDEKMDEKGVKSPSDEAARCLRRDGGGRIACRFSV